MQTEQQLIALLGADDLRWSALASVRDLALPDAWIAAGFIRNFVWDGLNGTSERADARDVDVIWFNVSASPADDEALTQQLARAHSGLRWSVKNQAHLHQRNGDKPYASATDAMRFWPETATAVAARQTIDDRCEIAAPFGLTDLFALRLRPTPLFVSERRPIFDSSLATHEWRARWPKLEIVDGTERGLTPPQLAE